MRALDLINAVLWFVNGVVWAAYAHVTVMAVAAFTASIAFFLIARSK